MEIKREKLKLVIIMGISYMLMVLPIWNIWPLQTSTDELGTIVGAAYFAGLDWSDVIVNSGYYGWGWYSLFFWVFKITDNPMIIYRIINLANSLIRVLIIPIAFYIGEKYLRITNKKILYLCAALMPWMTTQSIGMMINEYILEFIIWTIMLVLCKILQYNHSNRKLFYLILMLVLSGYSLLIHTRALVILIAVSITLVFYYMIQKNIKFSILILLGASAAYLIAQDINSFYQNQVWNTAENLRNAAVTISKIDLFNIDTWVVWAHMVIGLLTSENILTGGLFSICVIVIVVYFRKLCTKEVEMNPYLNIILVVSILCTGATILGFLVSGWFKGMVSSWDITELQDNYEYRGLTYVRYWNVYLPPAILCALSLLDKLKYKMILNISVIVTAIFCLGFIAWVLPLIKDHGGALTTFFGLSGYKFGTSYGINDYYKGILISLLIFSVYFWALRAKRYPLGLSIMIIFMIGCHLSYTYNFDNIVKEAMSSKILASYEEKCDIEKSGLNIGQIYLYDTEGGDINWKIYSIAQFYFNQYTLRIGLPDHMEKNDIIIAPCEIDDIDKQYINISCYRLDNNEIWYTYLPLQGEY